MAEPTKITSYQLLTLGKRRDDAGLPLRGEPTQAAVDAENVSSEHILPGAVGTSALADNAVVQAKIADASVAASKIMAGVVDATKLAAGQGLNLLPNGDFSAWDATNSLPRGWILTYGGGSPSFTLTAKGVNLFSAWSLLGNTDAFNTRYLNTAYMEQGAPAGNGNAYAAWVGPAIPAAAASRYCASVYTGAHRCRVAVSLVWYSDTGGNTYLGEAPQSVSNNEASIGGPALANYQRSYSIGTAPTGTMSARVFILKYDTAAGQVDSYSFVCRAQFEEVGLNASGPGPWVPPAANIIAAENILAGSVVAGKIAAAAVGAAEIAAGSVIAGKLTVTNFDNLWPNGTSEDAPPAGTSYTAWNQDAGAAAVSDSAEFSLWYDGPANYGYAGNRVRICHVYSTQGSKYLNHTVRAQPGEYYTFSAKSYVHTLGTGGGSGARIEGAFLDAGGNAIGSWVNSAYDTVLNTAWGSHSIVLGPAPAGTVKVRVLIAMYGGDSAECRWDQMYLKRMASAEVIVDGAIVASKIQADALQTADYAEDGSGNPTAGVKMLSGGASAAWSSGTTYAVGDYVIYSSKPYKSIQASNLNHQPDTSPTWWRQFNPLRVGSGGLLIGSRTIDELSVAAFKALARSNANADVVWYRGNNDNATLGGAPNIQCLTIVSDVDAHWDGTWNWPHYKFTIQPTAASDNLDGLRYLKLTFWSDAFVTLKGTRWVVVPDRLYNVPGTASDTGNSYVVSFMTRLPGPSQFTGTPVYPTYYIEATLYNAFGPSAAKRFVYAILGNAYTQYSAPSGGGGGGGGGGCVDPETPVLYAPGKMKPIRTFRPGDLVWTTPEGGGPFGYYRVLDVQLHRNATCRVSFTDGRSFVSSINHLVNVRGVWRRADSLKPGEEMAGDPGGRIASVEYLGEGAVVKMPIKTARTYYAGNGCWHHNPLKP